MNLQRFSFIIFFPYIFFLDSTTAAVALVLDCMSKCNLHLSNSQMTPLWEVYAQGFCWLESKFTASIITLITEQQSSYFISLLLSLTFQIEELLLLLYGKNNFFWWLVLFIGFLSRFVFILHQNCNYQKCCTMLYQTGKYKILLLMMLSFP